MTSEMMHMLCNLSWKADVISGSLSSDGCKHLKLLGFILLVLSKLNTDAAFMLKIMIQYDDGTNDDGFDL